MIRYVIKRLLFLIPVIIVVSFIVFSLMELAPGDAFDVVTIEGLTPEEIAELRAEYNLDRSMFYRYGVYMINLAQGDLGVSIVTRVSVWSTFIRRLPNTLLLSFSALILGVAVAVPLGITAARKSGTIIDNITTGVTLVGMSMPVFWIGLLLLLVFAFHLGLLPAGGTDHGIRSLILPAICSGLSLTASTARQTRSGMLEVLKSDYLRTARAKGVPEQAVIRRHALSNAWIPIVTAAGISFSIQLAGSVVVESVFAWPGIGRMAAEAVFQRDVTTATGTIIMTSVLYVLVQLIVDVLYAFIDPRIKAQYASVAKKKKIPPSGASIRREYEAERQEEMERELSALHGPAAPAQAADGSSPEDISVASQDEIMAVPAAEVHSDITADKAAETRTSFVTRVAFGSNAEATACDVAGVQDDTADGDSETRKAGDDTLATKKYRRRSQMGDIFYRMRKNKGSFAGMIIVCILFVMFVASFFITYEMITARDMSLRLTSPGSQYWLGADHMGRDMFVRLLYGTRYTLAIGFGCSAIGAVVGISLGSVAGYAGKKTDEVIMRFSDILASIPGLLLGMVIVSTLGRSLQNLILAVGISGIPIYIRIARASVLTLRNSEFVEAARAIGLPNPRIIFSQILPNGLSPIIVAFTVNFGMTIIVAASLSFIGFGVPVPYPEWGALAATGREFMRSAPWLVTYPGLFIMVTVLAFNLIGDGLRDALDPKLKKR